MSILNKGYSSCTKCGKALITTGDTVSHCIKCDYEVNTEQSCLNKIKDFLKDLFSDKEPKISMPHMSLGGTRRGIIL